MYLLSKKLATLTVLNERFGICHGGWPIKLVQKALLTKFLEAAWLPYEPTRILSCNFSPSSWEMHF
jgi:hypothetical protein